MLRGILGLPHRIDEEGALPTVNSLDILFLVGLGMIFTWFVLSKGARYDLGNW
jgi:hypothetical protein